jgi:hypothetical protein
MKARAILLTILLLAAGSAWAQQVVRERPQSPYANFPPIPPLVMYQEVLGFRSEIEGMIATAKPTIARSDSLVALIDRLVTAWDRYGDFMDREHGDFPNMSRNRPYWLIATDDAADTLTTRMGSVLASYVKANPQEKLGAVRVEWEIGVEQLGVPRSKLFGFQFVELSRRGAVLRKVLEEKYPADKADARDAYLRFLWDTYQFYAQLHSTWFDRNTLRIAQEDWIVYRSKGSCKETKWKMITALTAVGVDTSNFDPMSDKFMHRLLLFDPDCGDTLDFVMPLPHYRLMEKELARLTPAQQDSLMKGISKEMIERGKSRPGAPAPGVKTR